MRSLTGQLCRNPLKNFGNTKVASIARKIIFSQGRLNSSSFYGMLFPVPVSPSPLVPNISIIIMASGCLFLTPKSRSVRSIVIRQPPFGIAIRRFPLLATNN